MAVDAHELIRSWPTLGGLGAEAVLSHPAWRMPVLYRDSRATLVASSGVSTGDQTLALSITLDGEPHVLCVVPSDLTPDLKLILPKRAALPPEILMALVERECGDLLSLVEKTLRRQVGVKGFADGADVPLRAFRLETGAGSLEFALDLTPELLTVFGQVEFLDPKHGSIRALTRPAYAVYSPILLTEEECVGLAPGCCIVPPGDLLSQTRWAVELPTDDIVNVLSANPTEISFAAFADGELPSIPPPTELALCRHGRVFAQADVTRLGDATVLKVSEIFRGH